MDSLHDVLRLGTSASRICVFADDALLRNGVDDFLFARGLSDVAAIPSCALAVLFVSNDIVALRSAFARTVGTIARRPPTIAFLLPGRRRMVDDVSSLVELGFDDAHALNYVASEEQLLEMLMKSDKRTLAMETEMDAERARHARELECAHNEFKWGLIGCVFHAIPPLDHDMIESTAHVGDISIVSKLGAGTYGCVRRARRDTTTLALKTLPKAQIYKVTDIASIDREIAILRLVSGHPRVVSIVEPPLHGVNSIHIAMTYAGRRSLHWHLVNSSPTRATVETAAAQCAAGVAHLHRADIAHRDIKPDNFVVADAEFAITLVDMGLAIVTPTDNVDMCGTIPFLAPEAALECRYSAIAADAWSLGAVFLELNYGAYTVEHLVDDDIYNISTKLRALSTSRPSSPYKSERVEITTTGLLRVSAARRDNVVDVARVMGDTNRVTFSRVSIVSGGSFHNVCARSGWSVRDRDLRPRSYDDVWASLITCRSLKTHCEGMQLCVKSICALVDARGGATSAMYSETVRRAHYHVDIFDEQFDAVVDLCGRDALQHLRADVMQGTRARIDRARIRLAEGVSLDDISSLRISDATRGIGPCIRWTDALLSATAIDDRLQEGTSAIAESSFSTRDVELCDVLLRTDVEDAHIKRLLTYEQPHQWSDALCEGILVKCAATPDLAGICTSGFGACVRTHQRRALTGSVAVLPSRAELGSAHRRVRERHFDAYVKLMRESGVPWPAIRVVEATRPWISGDAAAACAGAMDRHDDHLLSPAWTSYALDELHAPKLDAVDVSAIVADDVRRLTIRDYTQPYKYSTAIHDAVQHAICESVLADDTISNARLALGRLELTRIPRRIPTPTIITTITEEWTLKMVQDVVHEAWTTAAKGTSADLRRKLSTRNGCVPCMRFAAARVIYIAIRAITSDTSFDAELTNLRTAHQNVILTAPDITCISRLCYESATRRMLDASIFDRAMTLISAGLADVDRHPIDTKRLFDAGLINVILPSLYDALAKHNISMPPVMHQTVVWRAIAGTPVDLKTAIALSPYTLRRIHRPLDITSEIFTTFVQTLRQILQTTTAAYASYTLTETVESKRPYIVRELMDDKVYGYHVCTRANPPVIVDGSEDLMRTLGLDGVRCGVPMTDIQGPLTDLKIAGTIAHAAFRDTPATVQLVNYARDGRPILVQITTVPIANRDRFLTYVTVLRDPYEAPM